MCHLHLFMCHLLAACGNREYYKDLVQFNANCILFTKLRLFVLQFMSTFYLHFILISICLMILFAFYIFNGVILLFNFRLICTKFLKCCTTYKLFFWDLNGFLKYKNLFCALYFERLHIFCYFYSL